MTFFAGQGKGLRAKISTNLRSASGMQGLEHSMVN